jgi:zinc transport system ATP-binding protein
MTEEPSESLLALDEVWFHRGATPVLENLTLTVARGRFVGIIGPNGGGKTTLLRLILGLLRPTRGTIRVFDQVVNRPGQFGGAIAHVPQRSDVDWSFPTRVIDVVAMGSFGRLGLGRRVPRRVRDEAMERLDWLGISDLAQSQIGNLSGGQQRRAFIARALMGEPDLLLLDEPCAGLDQGAHSALIGQLRNLQRRLGLTVVMASHDIAELLNASDRIACIDRTLHWHDHPREISREMLESAYACELTAYHVHHNEICHEGGVGHDHTH